MNFGKLLGAGKSFVSGHKSAAYRADKRFYLPQFGSPKNPFNRPVPAETLPELSKSVPENLSAPEKKAAPPVPAVKEKKSKLAPRGATAEATRWISKLNPVSIFGPPPPTVNKNATPVQVEMSLEKVKVVHNDLTDAEVEIVPLKSRPARVAQDLPAAKKSWETLGERIMKATAL